MKTSARPALRTTLGRVAVAGAATLASMTAGAPSAFAADDLAPESTELPTNDETAAPAPAPEVAPTAAEQEPPPVQQEVEEQAPDAPALEVQATPDAPEQVPAPASTDEQPQAAEPEITAEEAEYGAQSFTLTVTRAPGQFFPESYGVTQFVQTNGVVYRGTEFVDYIFCNTEIGFSPSAPSSSSCVDGNGNSTFQLAAGERVELETSASRTPIQNVTIEPCLVDECSAAPKDVPYLVEGPAPSVRDSDYPTQTFQGETIDVDLLANDYIGDPNTSVRIVSGPSHGTATLGSDGRTLMYTSVEDYAGTDTVTFEATNTNGTTTADLIFNVRDPLVPIFGDQKYRIGVQIESGAFVPAGTTTAGSTFEIVTTAPDGTERTTTCITTPTGPDGSSDCFRGFFGATAEPGERVVITQTGVPEGQAILPDPEPVVIEPCDSEAPGACADTFASFATPGSILPETQPDTATADEGGEPIDIDVLANDDSEDPNTTLSVTPLPAGQGTIEIVGEGAPAQPPVDEEEPATPDEPVGVLAVPSAGSLALRYTPAASFSGTVPVQYTVSNSNGSTTETLTITVRAGAVDPTPPTDPVDPTPPVNPANPIDSADPADPEATPGSEEPADVASGEGKVAAKAGASNASLPDAGGPNLSLLGLGALLAAAGSGVVARSRRRPAVTRER
ncbi:Ig-like domain-containing protein [Aeromicrobium sp. CF3.5]|uniref:Ig-like domain-containing protein n=1 Tax=Aeromicrobium sp. CF3.5 TaxID=3373078 RepID=UPI003EE65640